MQGIQGGIQQQGGSGTKPMMPSEAVAEAAAGICWNHWQFPEKTVEAWRRLPATGRKTWSPGVFERLRPWTAGSQTGRCFLIDTGASYIIFPHCVTLTGANGKRMPCWGERAVQLNFHGCRFDWTFLLADVRVGFLRNHKLLVDPAANRLVDTASLQSFSMVSAAGFCAASAIQSPPSTDSCGGTPPPRGQPDAPHHRRVRRSG